jgi:hypothetical protein
MSGSTVEVGTFDKSLRKTAFRVIRTTADETTYPTILQIASYLFLNVHQISTKIRQNSFFSKLLILHTVTATFLCLMWIGRTRRTHRHLSVQWMAVRGLGWGGTVVRTLATGKPLPNRTHNWLYQLSFRSKGGFEKYFYLSIYISAVLWLDLDLFFSFLILYTASRIPCTSDQPLARPLPTRRTTQTQNKRTQTSMFWVGFEPTIPASERAKIVHVLDRAATVTGEKYLCHEKSWRRDEFDCLLGHDVDLIC